MAKSDDTQVDPAQVMADALAAGSRRPAPDRLRKGLSEDDDDAN